MKTCITLGLTGLLALALCGCEGDTTVAARVVHTFPGGAIDVSVVDPVPVVIEETYWDPCVELDYAVTVQVRDLWGAGVGAAFVEAGSGSSYSWGGTDVYGLVTLPVCAIPGELVDVTVWAPGFRETTYTIATDAVTYDYYLDVVLN
jgi:hypothetical protein